MLTTPEKILFVLGLIASTYAAYLAASRIIRTLARGHGQPDWQLARKRIGSTLFKTISFQPVFRFRF